MYTIRVLECSKPIIHVVGGYSVMVTPMDDIWVIGVMVTPMDDIWITYKVVVAYSVMVTPMDDI